MTKAFFEPATLKKLSNKELIQKQEELDIKMGLFSNKTGANAEIYSQMMELMDYYDAEINFRLESELMDEDELEDFN